MDSRTYEVCDDKEESVRDTFIDREINEAVTESLPAQEKQVRLERRFGRNKPRN